MLSNWTSDILQYPLNTANEGNGNQCLPIEEPSCLGSEYTHTYLPNVIGLTSQSESAKRIRDYASLLKLGCSSYLEFFLCSIYFPMCTGEVGEEVLLLPCASFCRYIRQRCAPLMHKFNFPWPEELDCSKLPKDDEMCIRPHSFNSDTQISDATSHLSEEISLINDNNLISNASISQEFTSKQRTIAKFCIIAVTTLNASFCFISMYFYLCYKNRFVHPLRPLIFLTNACILESASYLPQLLRQQTLSSDNTDVESKVASISCVAQFAIAYYARTAMGIWFVLISLSWFLSASKSWAPEAIRRFDRWFYVMAWILPVLPPACILFYRTIDIDELTNSCYIGELDRIKYFLLVVLPDSGLVLIGGAFLALTLASLLRVHGELGSFRSMTFGLTMKRIRTPANQRRLLKVFNRAVFTVVCVAGPLLLGAICNLWRFFDYKPGKMAVRLLKIISTEMVGIGTTLVLWCNCKTFRLFSLRGKDRKHLNLTQFEMAASSKNGETYFHKC